MELSIPDQALSTEIAPASCSDAFLTDARRAEAGSTTAAASSEEIPTLGSEAVHATLPVRKASSPNCPGGNVFLKGSVACMASEPRVEISSELAAAVVETASALLASVRKESMHGADALQVERTWACMDSTG